MNPEEQRTSCPGFLDEYGIWNNGFECPPIAGQRRICCGTDSHLYCCSSGNIYTSSLSPLNHPEKSTREPTSSFIDKFNSIFFTLPFVLTCILILIILLLLTLIILFVCYRYRKQNQTQQEDLSTKQTSLVDHFPFSPPHHQLFFNENNPQTCLLQQQQTRDPLTTSTTSSKSIHIPSNIYYNDWKEFFNTTEQPMNLYPTMSSHSNEIHNDHSYIHSNYLFNAKQHQEDIIV
jgi:hypothetical protein